MSLCVAKYTPRGACKIGAPMTSKKLGLYYLYFYDNLYCTLAPLGSMLPHSFGPVSILVSTSITQVIKKSS
jgi:hypothetical protein